MLVLPLVLTPGCTPAMRGCGHIRSFQVLGLSSKELKIRTHTAPRKKGDNVLGARQQYRLKRDTLSRLKAGHIGEGNRGP